jgi:PDZ domain-containing secreted protein
MPVMTAARRDTKRERLRRHPLVGWCAPPEVVRLAGIFDEVSIPAGAYLLEEAPLARWFFLIEDGEAEVTTRSTRLADLGPGDCCGQDALLLRAPQRTTVRARTDMRVFAASGRDLLSLLTELPALAGGPLGALIPPAPPKPAAPVRPRETRVPSPRQRPARHLSRPTAYLVAARATPPPPPPPRSLRPWLAAAGVLVALLIGASRYHPPVLMLSPGPAVDITDDVVISGVAVHRPNGRYLMTSVRFSRPTLLALGLTGVWGQRETVPLHHATGDRSALHREGQAMFEASRNAAATAAARAAGLTVNVRNGRAELPFKVSFRHRDIVGPSAGLAYALLITDMLAPGDLASGRVLAATGTIDADGVVGLVSGIAEKAVGARHAGGAMLLLPIDQMVGNGNLGISILGVASLDDALRALRAEGAT